MYPRTRDRLSRKPNVWLILGLFVSLGIVVTTGMLSGTQGERQEPAPLYQRTGL